MKREGRVAVAGDQHKGVNVFFLVREIKGVDDLEVGTIIPFKAVTADRRPHVIPEIILSRGANPFLFRPGQPALIVLKGEFWHKNFWSIDLETSQQRQLTNFGPEFLLGDFDISADGKEIIFGRLKENSRVIMIDLPQR